MDLGTPLTMNPTPSRNPLVPFLASGLTAGLLNTMVSALDHPRAFADLGKLGLVALTTIAAFGVFGLLVRGVLLLPQRCWGWSSMASWAAVGSLAATLALVEPVAEVLLREMPSEHIPGLLGLCALGAVSLPLAALFAVERFRKADWAERAGDVLLLGLPLALFLLATAQWLLDYPLIVSGLLLRGFVGLLLGAVALGLLIQPLRGRWKLPVMPGLLALTLVVIVFPLVGSLLAAPSLARSRDIPAGAPRRVVLLTVDTLRADRIRRPEDNQTESSTPALSGLAADSVVFERARSAAPWTKPALATILTGVAPVVHGTTRLGVRLPSGLDTLAERMQAAGYATGGVGLNVHLEHTFNFSQGFQDYAFPALPENGTSVGAFLLEYFDREKQPVLFPTTGAIATEAIDWIAEHQGEDFFLWVHLLDPHWPYEPPKELITPGGGRIGDSWGWFETVTNAQAGGIKLSEAERLRIQELYRGEIDYTDQNIARILDRLKKLGLYEDALIVFASDHGEEFWEHGSFEHGHTMYDEVVHVPLMVKLPGSALQGTNDVDVSTAAVTPTILDLCGVPVAGEDFSAASLRPLWEDPAAAPAPGVFASGTHYYGEKLMTVFDGWKYVLDVETGREYLFNLVEDPEELRNLAALYPDLVKQGGTAIDRYLTAGIKLRERLGLKDESATVSATLADRMQALGYGGSERHDDQDPGPQNTKESPLEDQ